MILDADSGNDSPQLADSGTAVPPLDEDAIVRYGLSRPPYEDHILKLVNAAPTPSPERIARMRRILNVDD